jgi:hypothetical protein
MFWGGAGIVAAVVIAYVAFFLPSPNDEDLQGAIGAAKQYRADQISDADVVLQDPEIQQLLQSDFFYKLATDDDFREVAVDQLARLDLASGRGAQFTCATSLADMKSFLDLALNDSELKMALAEGKLNVVAGILANNKRPELIAVANRIYVTEGRNPQLNADMLGDMKSFLSYALDNAELKMALAEGRMDVVSDILASGKRPDLNLAAQKVFIAESRRAQLDAAGLASMKVFLDFAVTNAELKTALAEGRMDVVNEILASNNRPELLDAANRIYLTQGRNAQLNAAAFGNMKSFLDFAMANRDLKVALADGRVERVDEILVKDGRSELSVAAHKVFLADSRQAQFVEDGLKDLKVFLNLAVSNADLKAALAEGKMNVVNQILASNKQPELIYAANRICLTQGRNAQLNAAALGDMKSFLDFATENQNLKTALAEGRVARVDEMLVSDGKVEMCLAANRVYLTENRQEQLTSDAGLANARSIASFANENGQFRQALQDGRLDVAARIALAAGKYDISLRSVYMADFVVGERRSFVTDLNRILTVAESPSYKLSAANAGWGRLVTSVDATSWKQTVNAVSEGKMVTHY